ncbi:hypothetical protein KC19_VG137100 [Ceratodon purpureus]|uniref:Uncharacterized protein n=1 Tax=Ceratodon purpureus TaxID=3225 RepID=A0A8T0HQ77_CERPU|nr:hypothetical protein KC19_VG137100 [Ceratodon purpureus]
MSNLRPQLGVSAPRNQNSVFTFDSKCMSQAQDLGRGSETSAGCSERKKKDCFSLLRGCVALNYTHIHCSTTSFDSQSQCTSQDKCSQRRWIAWHTHQPGSRIALHLLSVLARFLTFVCFTFLLLPADCEVVVESHTL